MSPPDDDEAFLDEERTAVDPVVDLSDVPTRKAERPCGHCGLEGTDPRGRCAGCGLVPAASRDVCLGCTGSVVFVGMLGPASRPRTYEDAIRLSGAGGSPVCLSCPTWWVCAVARGRWSG